MHCENKGNLILNDVRELSHSTFCHSLQDANKKKLVYTSAEGGKIFLFP